MFSLLGYINYNLSDNFFFHEEFSNKFRVALFWTESASKLNNILLCKFKIMMQDTLARYICCTVQLFIVSYFNILLVHTTVRFRFHIMLLCLISYVSLWILMYVPMFVCVCVCSATVRSYVDNCIPHLQNHVTLSKIYVYIAVRKWSI